MSVSATNLDVVNEKKQLVSLFWSLREQLDQLSKQNETLQIQRNQLGSRLREMSKEINYYQSLSESRQRLNGIMACYLLVFIACWIKQRLYSKALVYGLRKQQERLPLPETLITEEQIEEIEININDQEDEESEDNEDSDDNEDNEDNEFLSNDKLEEEQSIDSINRPIKHSLEIPLDSKEASRQESVEMINGFMDRIANIDKQAAENGKKPLVVDYSVLAKVQQLRMQL